MSSFVSYLLPSLEIRCTNTYTNTQIYIHTLTPHSELVAFQSMKLNYYVMGMCKINASQDVSRGMHREIMSMHFSPESGCFMGSLSRRVDKLYWHKIVFRTMFLNCRCYDNNFIRPLVSCSLAAQNNSNQIDLCFS